MESFATPYPVLFSDGEQEHDKGHVGVHSVLTFKRFQALMAQRTGIPASQLCSVFVCRRIVKDTEKKQKLPINENTNFNIILNQHNPSRERDCHFLVSIKKSKKERKVSRKRSSEADKTDDEDSSSSSRGDLSPADERPKVEISEENNKYISEASGSSPRHFTTRPSSPAIVPAFGGNAQQTTSPRHPSASSSGIGTGSGIPIVKPVVGEATEPKAEKTVLRREGGGRNGSATSPRAAWVAAAASAGPQATRRLDGLSIPSGHPAKVGNHALQPVSSGSVLQKADERRKSDKHRRQASPGVDDKGTPKANGVANSHSRRHPASGSDLLHQERLKDPMAQGANAPVPRPPTPAVLPRGNGLPSGSSPALQRSIAPNNNLRPNGPLISPATAAAFIQRVTSMGNPAGVRSPNATGLTLQQAHIAHLQHCRQQQQQQEDYAFQIDGGAVNQLELGKLFSMLRTSLARETRYSLLEIARMCKLCYILREKNLGPAPFHWCLDDAVTKGIKGPSPAGTIGKPAKRHVEAAA